MDLRETTVPSAFDILFTKSVPHIFENIFFTLDYESFKSCMEVNKSWNEVMTSESFQKLGETLFKQEIERDLFKAVDKPNFSGVAAH